MPVFEQEKTFLAADRSAKVTYTFHFSINYLRVQDLMR
jgi:hypothetical protein